MGRLGKIDPNSYSEPEHIKTVHSTIEWSVNFEEHKLFGQVTHRFKVLDKHVSKILLDVRNINVSEVAIMNESSPTPIKFSISDAVENIGEKLTLVLPGKTVKEELNVRIVYETSANASALQWIKAEETLDKQFPYMFSVCQAIHCRSILPCQDTPAVKFTYEAVVNYPKNLVALMSAIRDDQGEGVTKFKQVVPIPSYLVAIAVGKLVSKPIGPISNVWSESKIIDACAEEFSETNEILKTAIGICGEYVWKVYDILVLPPSFPYGGMENPCLTFVTSSLLAGDKSLSNFIAHEIAHSWTGNLVTNKNFEHFWLNEGFTVFIESKIIGRLCGQEEQDFHMIRNLNELQECISTQMAHHPEFTKLIVDLSDCGPDDSLSRVPYVKGSVFLRYIEDLVGGPQAFEPFLKFYLQKFAYKSITTVDFKETLKNYYVSPEEKQKLNEVDWDLWLKKEGMPPIIPKLDESLANLSKQLAYLWTFDTLEELKKLPEIKEQISTYQLIDLLTQLIQCDKIVDLNEEKIKFFETNYNISDTKNSEIKFRLLRLYIKAKLINRIDEIFEFVNSNFRMKFCRPIYRDLVKWSAAKPMALENFNSVKSQMMTVCSYKIEKDLHLLKAV